MPATRRTGGASTAGLGDPLLVPEALGPAATGLWLRPRQTFGIELELTRSDYPTASRRSFAGVAEHIRRSLAESFAAPVFPRRAGENKSYRYWNVEEDESAGWEISSRVVAGVEGMREIARGLAIVEEIAGRIGLRVGHETGVHVHLGWKPHDHRQAKRLIRLVKIFEPGLATIVTPARIVEINRGRYDTMMPNRFCAPISTVFSRNLMRTIRSMRQIAAEAGLQRNTTVNLASLAEIGTVEVRLLGGTLSAGVILPWISLWQQILWAASRRRAEPLRCPPDVDVLAPVGDIVDIAHTHLPELGRERMVRWLDARRRQMGALWRRHPDLKPWAFDFRG